MHMNATANEILSDVKLAREVRDDVTGWRDYWSTYCFMAICSFGFPLLEHLMRTKTEAYQFFLAVLLIVSSAMRDTQKGMNRRIGALVELLNKRGQL